MRSSGRSDLLDLERGLPTTAADVAALRRARTVSRLDLDGYLRFLQQFPTVAGDALRARRGPGAAEPFTLRDSKPT